VKNRKHSKTDYDFLNPLVDRPDLEPDPDFIMSLRKKIINNDKKKFRMPGNFNFVGVSLLAIITLSLLMYTIDFSDDSLSTLQTEPASHSDTTQVPNYDIKDLITANYSYNSMYQKLLEAEMPDRHAAEVFILYLEALKNNDAEQYGKYSVNHMDGTTETLMTQYNEIYYNTFYIENITPSKGEPVYEVNLKFTQKGGNTGAAKIYIQFFDSKVSINQSLENFITDVTAVNVPKQTVSIMETVEFDTLCFNGRLIVDMYMNTKFVNGCTTDKGEIESVLSIIDNIPIKEPSQEESDERLTALQQTDNYQIYLGNSVAYDERKYTITLYEDGIFQYQPMGMEGLGDITTKPYVEKYSELKKLLDEIAE